MTAPRIVPFIFSWRNQFEKAVRTEDQLREIFDRVVVINSDDDRTREGWVDVGDEYFFTAQFFKAIELFDGDILFHVQADASYHDWRPVFADAVRCFERDRWGVFAPNVDFTPWVAPAVDIDSDYTGDPELRLVACTDCTCWFIHRDVIDAFVARKHLFAENRYGWGVDLTMSALSHLAGRPVIRDYTHTIVHPRGRGYDDEGAKREYAKFLAEADPELASVLKLILEDRQALAGMLKPPSARLG